MDQYHNFEQLRQHAREKRDYVIEVREGTSGVAVMAPHGGAIEPGTAAIASAIAGQEHSYYAFKGLLPGRNNRLHLASVRFDEPRAMGLVGRSHTIITVHGCVGADAVVYVGGKDQILKQCMIDTILGAGIAAEDSPGPLMRGIHPHNLCNRGTRGQGVQLEITAALRRQMMAFAGIHKFTSFTPLFTSLVGAIRAAIAQVCQSNPEKSVAFSGTHP